MIDDGEASINEQVVDIYGKVRALVTLDLSAQMLLSWHNFLELGILHLSFLNPIPTEALHVISHGTDPTPLPGDSAEKIIKEFQDVLMDT